MKRYRINGKIYTAKSKKDAATLYAREIGFMGTVKIRSLGSNWYRLTYPYFGSSQLTITEVK